MKTKKLLFTLIATMTMLFGATLIAHAEEAPAPSPLQVIGSDQLGYAIVPSNWTLIDDFGHGITYGANDNQNTICLMAAPYGGTLGELYFNLWNFAADNGLTVTDDWTLETATIGQTWNGMTGGPWHGQDTIWFTGTTMNKEINFTVDGSTYNCYEFLTPDGIAHTIIATGTVGNQFLDTYRFNGK